MEQPRAVKVSPRLSVRRGLRFKRGGVKLFDGFQHEACGHSARPGRAREPPCQSLEALLSELLLQVCGISERGRKRKKKEYTHSKEKKRKKNVQVASRHEKMPLSVLSCLGVMQISSGCLPRLNRGQNGQIVSKLVEGQQQQRKQKTLTPEKQTRKKKHTFFKRIFFGKLLILFGQSQTYIVLGSF